MNIHEYQAKQILGRFGVPVPKGQFATTPDEAAAAFTALGQPKAVVKAQIHAGGRGKAGGVKLLTRRERRARFRRQAARQAAGDASDRARRPRRAARIYRGGERRRARALPRDAGRSKSGNGFRDREHRRRHGYRGSRRQDAGKNSHRANQSAARRVGLPGAQDRVLTGPQGQASRPVRDAARGALPRVHRNRRVANRDQSAGRHQGQPRHLPRREDVIRRQRALPSSGYPRAARPQRGRSRRDRGGEVRPQLRASRRQHRMHGERRGPRDGDDGHRQDLRRRAGQLPRRRRRREHRESRRGVSHPARGQARQRRAHQHLRRHHAMRRAGAGRRRGGETGEAQRAAGGQDGRDQRRRGQEDSRRVRHQGDRRQRTWPTPPSAS